MGSPDLAAKRWVWQQYDHMVMADTVRRPGGDAAVIRIHGSNRGLALATDCTPRYCAADAVAGGRQAVAECWRNLTAVGARPLAVTDCMNFGSPERAEVMGQFVGAVEGLREACLALDFPVVSGNVSFYNETRGVAIKPTPQIGGVGLIDDLDRMVDLAFRAEGETVLAVGETAGHLGQSLFSSVIDGAAGGAAPAVDLAAERINGDFVREAIGRGRISACHDVADGGLLVAPRRDGSGRRRRRPHRGRGPRRPGLLVRRGPGALCRRGRGGAPGGAARRGPPGRRRAFHPGDHGGKGFDSGDRSHHIVR